MDMAKDGLPEDPIAVVQELPTLPSGSENMMSPRRNTISLSLEAHPKSRESNGNDHRVSTVREPTTLVTPELKIHWAAPVGMVAFFLSGVIVAIGHHIYYTWLDGTSISDDESQQWAVRFGTVFAFLVEISLVAAVSIAQMQRAWSTVERKSVSIGGIDSVFAATQDLRSFMSWEMLSRARLASLLALICWCLPLSALVTPATLTVRAVSKTRNVDIIVPAIDYKNANKFALLTTSAWDSNDIFNPKGIDPNAYPENIGYRYPSALISLLSVATASTGAIQSMLAPFSNTSYSSDFYGPAVQCKPANESAGRMMYDFLSSSAEYCPSSGPYSDRYGAFYFGMVPGRNKTTGKIYAVDLGQPSDPTDHNSSRPIAPELWFGWTTTDQTFQGPAQRLCNGRGGWKNITCVLYNASYSADFAFNGGVQSIKIKNIDFLEPMKWNIGVITPDMFAPFGVAPEYAVISYQAVWVALTQQLIGTLGSDPEKTRISQTPLVATKDLGGWAAASVGDIPPSIASIVGNRTLDALIEELAQNITLSLFSVSYLWNPNNTTPTTIAVGEMVNLYNYNSRNLLISYITAVVFAFIGTTVGIFSIIANDRSYSTPNSFSAILRTTRNQDLDELVGAKSLGVEPLNKSLANTRLRFGTIDGSQSDLSTRYLCHDSAQIQQFIFVLFSVVYLIAVKILRQEVDRYSSINIANGPSYIGRL